MFEIPAVHDKVVEEPVYRGRFIALIADRWTQRFTVSRIASGDSEERPEAREMSREVRNTADPRRTFGFGTEATKILIFELRGVPNFGGNLIHNLY